MKKRLKTISTVLLALVSFLQVLFGALTYNILDYYVAQTIKRYGLEYVFPRNITLFIIVPWVLFTIAFYVCLYIATFKEKKE